MSINPQPRFEKGDTVRVVTSDTPFFGWTGTVATCEDELELTTRHYLVNLHAFSELPDVPPMLFREMQLAFAYVETK